MSTKPNSHPGFPGDGDSNTEVGHGPTAYWTAKMTIWSAIMIAVGVAIVAAVALTSYGIL